VSFGYRLFGLATTSNIPIPGLVATSIQDPDVQILLGCAASREIAASTSGTEELTFTSSLFTDSGEPAFKIFRAGQIVHLVYQEGIEFWLDGGAGNIWGAWPGDLKLDDATAYLLGPVFGLLLLLRGAVCLHASAVAVENKAVLFVGDAGAGKSTTAAAMTRRGHALLADDIVAIAERDSAFFATPSFPYVSLWPESLAIIRGIGDELILPTDALLKERYSPSSFQKSALPVGAIFVLGERLSSDAAPRAEAMSSQQRLLALVASSYATTLLDGAARAREFRLFGEMIRMVPIWRLHAHSDALLLDRLCDVVEEQCKTP
jgi:hypothetical protein